MAEKADLGKSRRQALEDGVSTVGGAIVHDDDLALHVLRQGCAEDQGEAAFHNGAFVVDRHQDGQLHGPK